MDENLEEELQHAFISKLKFTGQSILVKVIAHVCNNPETVPEVAAFIFRKERFMTISEDVFSSLYYACTVEMEVFVISSISKQRSLGCYPTIISKACQC